MQFRVPVLCSFVSLLVGFGAHSWWLHERSTPVDVSEIFSWQFLGLLTLLAVSIVAILRKPQFGQAPLSLSTDEKGVELGYSRCRIKISRSEISRAHILLWKDQVCMVRLWYANGSRAWIPRFADLPELVRWLDAVGEIRSDRTIMHLRRGTLWECIIYVGYGLLMGVFVGFVYWI